MASLAELIVRYDRPPQDRPPSTRRPRKQRQRMVSAPAPEEDVPLTERLFSSEDACRLARISYRQLDYWERVGHVRAVQSGVGSGMRRKWTLTAVVQAIALGRLANALGSIGRSHRALPQLPESGVAVGDPYGEVSVFETEEAAASMVRALPSCWAVSLDAVRTSLLETLSKRPIRRSVASLG